MIDRIGYLIRLQGCDNRIRDLVNHKMEIPKKIQEFEDELKSYEMRFQEENQRLELLKKERRKIEQEIQDLEAKTDKSTIKLSHIKSNKEYQAALKEIEDLKILKFSTEDKTIEIMELIEELDKKRLSDKEKQKTLTKDYEEKKAILSQEEQDTDEEIKRLQKMRMEFCQTIDQELLERYDFLKERKGGQAISPVIQGICRTCNMGIPPQKFNELIKGKVLMNCPHCSRIIYWGEDEHYKKSMVIANGESR